MDDQYKERSRGSDDDISGENVGTPHIGVEQTAPRDGIPDVFSHFHKEFIDRHRQDIKQVSRKKAPDKVQAVVHHPAGRSLRILDRQVKYRQHAADAPEPEPDGIDFCYNALDDRLVKDDQPLTRDLRYHPGTKFRHVSADGFDQLV